MGELTDNELLTAILAELRRMRLQQMGVPSAVLLNKATDLDDLEAKLATSDLPQPGIEEPKP